ncbi:MAG: (5-formylfuran-3-yl)methyl phosphate synthase [Candidatus Hydrothermarchaeota archaeon]|nr:(5-formylfuran-3-yl)methyl phosphate synthase [Candidatus Hydrothermarchaeota archaeon]
MKLLVSPTNVREALEAVKGGADIIDVKNPREGSLGANYPWVIQEIKNALPERVETSATLGDLDFKPGTASLAALGLGSLGVNYAKAGLYGIGGEKEALEIGGKITRALKNYEIKVVLAGYAEYRELGSIPPYKLPSVARKCGAAGVMIDTAVKNGKSLLEHLSLEDLKSFADDAHGNDVFAALAGSLRLEDMALIKSVGCDIVGVRGLVCTGGDRLKGKIIAEKVRALKAAIS